VHGRLDFLNAIAYSCDVYFYELVRKRGLSSRILSEYAHRFGLGQRTGTGLPGEIPGLVPNPDYKKEEMGQDWRTGDTLNMVIGQGFLTATVMQVAQYTGVVATDGDVIEPNMVRKIAWPEDMHREPTLMKRRVRRHLDLPEELKQAQKGMRLAVTAEDGTAAILRQLPTSAAGKTGSAQHLRGRPTHAWFTAYAPYENPRFVCTALVTEGGWGSQTAGPIVVSILKAALESDI
jgi:penicillin-binding protein 2